MNYFLSTSKASGIYKILVNTTFQHASNIIKKKIFLSFIEKKKITFPFLLFYFKFLLKFFYLKEERYLDISYKKCNIGRHALAKTYRDVNSYKSKFNLYKNLLKNIYLSGIIVDTAHEYAKKSKALYVDHIGYLNGIYFSVFALKKKIIYTNCYPRGLFFIDFRKKKNVNLNKIENAIRLFKKKIVKRKRTNFIKKIINRPDLVPWMQSTNFEKFNYPINKFKEYNYIIYTHSFTDGQLWWGNDGFSNLLDWLKFTIDELIKINKKIIIKPHPNFYGKLGAEIQELDKKIYHQLIKKYLNSNIFFITKGLKNKDLLNSVNKNTILISHHGTALLEGATLGFKCISSVATLWRPEFKISNQWENKMEYKNLLNKVWSDLEFCNLKDLEEIHTQLYYNKYGYFGDKFWHKKTANLLREKRINLHLNPNKRITQTNQRKIKYIVKEVLKCIEEVSQ